MLPQFSAIPLQSTEASTDSSRNLNQLLPVGKNVSATVVAVSRDQIQPEIFRLKLEINNRLIQMGVFQALPIGQKINVNRQSDGQIQITPQQNTVPSQTTQVADKPVTQQHSNAQQPPQSPNNAQSVNIKLLAANTNLGTKLPDSGRTIAAVISSRPVYATSTPITSNQSPVTQAQTPPVSPSPVQQSISPQGSIQQTLQAQPASTQPQVNLSPSQSAANPITTKSAPPATISVNQTPGAQKTGPVTPINTTAQQTTTQTSPVISTNTQANPQPSTVTPQPRPAVSVAPQSTQQTNTTTANQPQHTGTPISTPVSLNVANPIKPETSLPAQNNSATRPASDGSQATNQAAQPAISNQTRTNVPPIHHAITLAMPDGSKIEVQSQQPLPQGAQVLLQKSSVNEAQVVKLQLPNTTPNSALEKPAIQEILRNALPVQLPTGTAFSQLAQAATAAEGSQAAQISSVVRSMLQLFGVKPGSNEAATQIRQNVELGGLHTERSLSEGKSPNPQDMKSQLQQLQNLADKLPEEQRERFEQLLRGLHSRVTSQQLNSLQQWKELPDGGFERVLQLDLPIKQGEKWDNLELRLSREGGSNAAGELISVWRVRLHFDLDELGGVDAEIRLSDEHEISTLFWCDKEGTAEKLRGRADEFAERLRDCGFSNSEVQWQQGNAPEQKQVVHKQLVDLHT